MKYLYVRIPKDKDEQYIISELYSEYGNDSISDLVLYKSLEQARKMIILNDYKDKCKIVKLNIQFEEIKDE